MTLGLCSFGLACVGGEITDSTGVGSSRFGPDGSETGTGTDTSDPSAPEGDSPLVCADASADVSASSGWQSSEVPQPASGVLQFELKARPTAAALDGVVAVGSERIEAFNEAAILVRFAEDGFVDARNGAIYDSDVSYPYDPGVWYDITVTADIQTKTYDVDIGRCGQPKQTLIEDASFRDDVSVTDQLSGWAVWSSQSAALEVSTPAWTESGGCVPATCETLGHTCGQPSDGCGGVLSCGGCNAGQACSSGTCVDASAPPPPCEPASCQTLNAECGLQGNGCGGFLNCGGCSTGQMCSGGSCIEEPAPPPPPACTPVTCQSLGSECGQWGDGCGGILSCGGCGSGEVCNGSGQCTSSSSSDWWDTVLKPNAANTGPNCTGRPGCPNAALSSSNAPPRTITTNGATYENFTMSGTLVVDADNVTLRNFSLQGSGVGDGTVITNRGRNLLIEYAEVNGGSNCGQILAANGWTVRYSELRNCADIVKIADGGAGNLGPVLVEDSYWHDVGGGHGDTIQIWPGTSSDVTFRRNHLEGGNTSIVIDWDINAPARLLFEENWLHGGGAGYVIYCSNSGGGARIYRNNLFDRNYVYGPVTDSGCTWSDNLYMDNFAPVGQ